MTRRRTGRRRAALGARLGIGLIALIVLLAILAPFVAPEPPGDQFPDRTLAPPMRVHLRDATGWRAPFVYPQRLQNREERRFVEDTTEAVPLRWCAGGHLVSIPESDGPLLLLGADELGRDAFSRLLYGARLSLGVTVLGSVAALLLGTAIGGLAGAAPGRTDTALMVLADFVLVLPGVYVVLVLRAVLPLTLSTPDVFWLMVGLFGVAGWPHVARGVRAIIAVERTTDYAEAARAAGAGPIRLARHLLPAARGFLGVEFALLVPALLVAEATILVRRPRLSGAGGERRHDAAGLSQPEQHAHGAMDAASRTSPVLPRSRHPDGRRHPGVRQPAAAPDDEREPSRGGTRELSPRSPRPSLQRPPRRRSGVSI